MKKISHRLIAGFFLIVVVFLGVGAAIQWNMAQLEHASATKDDSKALTDLGAQLWSDVLEQQNSVRGYVASRNPSFLKTYSEKRQSFADAADSFQRLSHDPAQSARLGKLKVAVQEWQSRTDVQIDLAEDEATAEQARVMVGELRLGPVRVLSRELNAAQDVLYAGAARRHEAAVQASRYAIWGGTGVAIVLALLAAGWLSRTIATPIAAMTKVMGQLAEGDHSVVPPAQSRADEIGDIGRAVAVFRAAGLEKVRLETEAVAQREVAETTRAQAERERVDAAQDLARVVETLASGLRALSQGDLTHRVNNDFPGEYAQLSQDFNSALQQLQDTVAVIVSNAHLIGSGAREITEAADDLSRRTEQQAASLEETAAALDEITATVARTAEGAGRAQRVVTQAKVSAEGSAGVVRQAIEAMGAIERSAQEIGQIIGVIDEIAFQTNLLALNAGVEAARAGDAGKGFAVVASEVRALAQRSAEAAKEIKTLIMTSRSQVETGVTLVAETGDALTQIVSQVGEITGVVVEIAASALEQSQGLREINTAINQMDLMTQQNAAMVEQSTAASHNLASESAELRRLTSQFKVGAVAERGGNVRNLGVRGARLAS